MRTVVQLRAQCEASVATAAALASVAQKCGFQFHAHELVCACVRVCVPLLKPKQKPRGECASLNYLTMTFALTQVKRGCEGVHRYWCEQV